MSPTECAVAALEASAHVVARFDGADVGAILRPSRLADRQRRQLAAYLAVTWLNQPLKRVARAAGVRPFTIRHGLARIEDLRDVPEADAWISQLEEMLPCVV